MEMQRFTLKVTTNDGDEIIEVLSIINMPLFVVHHILRYGYGILIKYDRITLRYDRMTKPQHVIKHGDLTATITLQKPNFLLDEVLKDLNK